MATTTSDYRLSQLDALETEAIHIIREAAAECENPALLFSGGKDSCVLLHAAVKAFYPAKVPFPVVHIDTGHNFEEVIEFRDRVVRQLGVRLEVGSVEQAIQNGRVQERPGEGRNRLQTQVLLDTIQEHGYDALFGGARRDEEKARAKERVFSFRDEFGQWEPKAQRPELWNLYNTRVHKGEHMRVFPLSNWTELDIWDYIAREGIDLPSIYFAHTRKVYLRDGMLLWDSDIMPRRQNEEAFESVVRYRTVGDISCTGAVESNASTVADVIAEVAASRITERGATRADDKFSEAAMEDRKREGYF